MKNVVIDVVCALILEGDSVWAAQRGSGEHAGMWEFPGGKVESAQGEAPESALIREIKEELDGSIEILSAGTPVEHDYGNKQVRLIPFYCRALSPLNSLEHSEIRLVNKKEALLLEWLPPDIPIMLEWLKNPLIHSS